jgi:hypothetical protein
VIIGYLLTQTGTPSVEDRLQASRRHLGPRETVVVIAGIIGFTVINSGYIAPHTLWFRIQSPPDKPYYMRTPAGVSFGDRFELLGYTLDTQQVAPNDTFDVMLFWRALEEIDREYRSVVQLVNLSQSEAWAVSQPFFPGGGKTIGYPADRFASEVHRLRVMDTAPSYVGRVLVQMVDSVTGEPLSLSDGSKYLLLEPLIRVRGSNPPARQDLAYTLGDSVDLWCSSVSEADDGYTVDLIWHVRQPVKEDFTVFVHGLDSAGALVVQADGPPLGGDYPTSLWQYGQVIPDRFILAANNSLAEIRIGFYTRETGRLPVTKDGRPVGDFITLPRVEQSCLE